MFVWLADNAVTLITIAVIMALVGIAVFALVKEKKDKTGSCAENSPKCGMGCSYGKKHE